jgi:hypothetical protein
LEGLSRPTVREQKNATHDDILFANRDKTPEIDLPQVRIHRKRETIAVIEHTNQPPTFAGFS